MKNAFKSFLIVGLFLAFQSCKDNPTGPGSSSGGKIVFSMPTGATPYNSGQTHVHIINADGSGLKQLTFGNHEDMPRWSPDGSQIVFVSDSLGTSLGEPMWIMNADGSNWRPVWRNPNEPTMAFPGDHPSWSPDGRKIIFSWCTHCEYGTMIWDIYVADLTTELIEQLTYGDPWRDTTIDYPIGSNGEPVFSPDGKKIYFSSSRDDSINGTIAGIFSMNPDGSDVQRVIVSSPTLGFHGSPSVSLDGKKLAFVQGDTSSSALYISNVDGSNIVKVADPPTGTSVRLPRWAPDSRHVMFISDSGEGGGIFVINIDGTNLRKLAVEDSVGYFDWIAE